MLGISGGIRSMRVVGPLAARVNSAVNSSGCVHGVCNVHFVHRNLSVPLPLVRVSEEVRAAVACGLPVVALETTVVAHGLPPPIGVETALALEDAARRHGCVPASVAVAGGRLCVGLDRHEIEALASRSEDGSSSVAKASRRDLALLAASGRTGATTVAATMAAAHRAGISVFATGGIGGVHRDALISMDVSADLPELARTPVAVVCAGVKSILDIGRTLEVLETLGVTVISYGPSRDFPAFFNTKSGFQSPANLETPEECAKVIAANQDLDLGSGILFAVPIPPEHEYPDHDRLEATIQDAIRDAARQNIIGKDITPFLLAKVKELTGGQSMLSNIALLKNNVEIASQIAVAHARLRRESSGSLPSKSAHAITGSFVRIPASTLTKSPLIIGGTVVDVTSKFDASVSEQSIAHTSSPGKVHQTLGGVGRNVAEACYRAGGNPVFLSVVGDDTFGQQAIDSMAKMGMNVSHIDTIHGTATAVYNAVLKSNGELFAAATDMDVHSNILKDKTVAEIRSLVSSHQPSIVCVDGNLTLNSLTSIAEACLDTRTPLCFEPTSVIKSKSLFKLPPRLIRAVSMVTPNEDELEAMSIELDKVMPERTTTRPDTENTPERHIENLLRIFGIVVAKLGPSGVLVGRSHNVRSSPYDTKTGNHVQTTNTAKSANTIATTHGTITRYSPCEMTGHPMSVTGAGDSLVGTMIAGISQRNLIPSSITPYDVTHLVRAGMRSAELTLHAREAVSPKITPTIFDDDFKA